MKRTLWIAVAAAWAALPAFGQEQQWNPPEPIPLEELAGFERYYEQQDLGSLDDSLTDDQLARRLSRLYRYQADLLLAQADGNSALGAEILHRALGEVEDLADQPGINANVRWRELFRSLVTEHDYYYGKFLEDEFGSIFGLRAEIFEELNKLEDPLAPAKTPAPLPPIRTTIPMTENRTVEGVREWFLTKRRDVLIVWLSRAKTYFPMIEPILKETGVPDELKYLAVIESGLNPKATSRWHAVGMWQFISATGRAYGLESDAWQDDRRDPVKATRAAAKHLRDLYYQYDKNWHVALAGYNCSPRCIKRAIRSSGGKVDYWRMYKYLPKETRGYVPNFIAVAQILSNPGAFGLPTDVTAPEFAYDIVPVTGMLSFETIADMVGANVDDIGRLNPELRQGMLPPSSDPYELRIPPGTASRFVAAFANLPAEAKRTAAEHIVKRGDNLGKIGRRYGVSARDLMASNNLRKTTIYPGQHLVVPTAGGGGGGQASVDESGVRTVNWGTHVNQPIALDFTPKPSMARTTPVRQTSQAAQSSSRSSSGSSNARTSQPRQIAHTVRGGDTLSGLAAKYGSSVRDIRQLNGLRSTKIKRGQTLKIQPGKNKAVVYKVVRGDNLTKIARRYKTKVSSIKEANNLRSNRIYPGQELTIISK